MNPGVAIMVDEQRDPTIARIFQHRAAQDDQTFLADWKPETTHTRVLLDPERSDALVAYTIRIIKPIVIRRTYLYSPARVANRLRGSLNRAPMSGSSPTNSPPANGPKKALEQRRTSMTRCCPSASHRAKPCH
jgi:hypothetical protein